MSTSARQPSGMTYFLEADVALVPETLNPCIRTLGGTLKETRKGGPIIEPL